ncbi:MAG: kelch repeat-containing protein [Elusimicrobiota bacterium]
MTNGKILVVGGTDAGGPTNTAEILDITRGSEFVAPQAVAAANPMTFARSSATITVLPNGNVLVSGGWDGANARCDAEVYNPNTGLWTIVGASPCGANSMSSGRFNHTATPLLTGGVLVCGGQTGAADLATPTCDIFSPTGVGGCGTVGGCFAATGSLLLGRYNHSSTLLNDGTVWVAGGWSLGVVSGATNNNPPYVVTTERYSPGSGTWSQSQPLNEARANHTATLTGDNKVLLAGGRNGNTTFDTLLGINFPRFGLLNSSELFDPTGGAPTQGPPLEARVQAHAATLLPSGIVSIYGGRGNIPPSNITSLLLPTIFASGGITGSFTGVYSNDVITGGNGTIPISFYLGTPVTGSIVDGDVEFINPKITMTGATVALISNNNNPALGLRASLNGVNAGCDVNGTCGYVNTNIALLNFQGTYSLTNPVTVSNNLPNQGVTGSITINPAIIASNINSGVAAVTAGNFTTHLELTVPSFLTGYQVSSVTLTLGPSDQVSWSESSYTVTLNGGSGLAVGPFPVITAAGVSYIDLGLFTFNNIVGSLVVTATDPTFQIVGNPVAIPLAGGAARLASANISMNFAASGINLTGQTLAFDSVNIVVRDLIFGDNEYFMPNTNQWSFSPPSVKPVRPGYPRYGVSSLVTPSGTEFDIGGLACGPGCASFIPATGGAGGSRLDYTINWTAGPTSGAGADLMIHAFHTATSLPDGTILLAGGTDGSIVLSSAEVFNPGTQSFAPTNTLMTSPRQQHSASLLPNGRVLLAGGFTTAPGSGPTNSAEIYYPDTKVFLPVPPMNSARSQHVAITLPNGNVFVAGGFNGLNTVTGSADIYSSTAPSWTAVPDMTTAAGGTGALEKRAIAAGVQLQDGRIMLCGGTNESGILNSVVAYDPATNSWAALHLMPAALQGHTATLLFDGRVLVAGGNNGTGETNSSFIYDPVGDSWSVVNALRTARFGHTATLLPNGEVVIAGGVQGSGATASAVQTMEHFVPDWASWVDTSGADVLTSGPRADHTATLASDGHIYFIGGINGSIGTGGTATFYKNVDVNYFTMYPDQYSNSQPSLRQSTITATTATSPVAAPVLPGTSFNVTGLRFREATEASGGTGAAATSLSTPRLILQKIDGSNGGGSSSSPGFTADLTSQIYATPSNLTTLNTSLNVTLPNNNALPYGWYTARVGASDLYSKGLFVQVGPPKPAAAPSGLNGFTKGVSSITWTWNALPLGTVDGYNVYQASTSVFIGTVAAVGGLVSFTETGLTPNSRVAVIVAGYTISGDGPSSLSPFTSVAPIATITTIGCGLNNTGDSTSSIPWSWNTVASASSYNVYNSSTGALIANTSAPGYPDLNLATNSLRSIYVGAVTGGIEGPLSPSATCYTQAAVPALPSPGTPLMTSTDTASVSLNWTKNGNPDGTIYQAAFTSYVSTASLIVTTVTVTQIPVSALQAYLGGLVPSQYYSAQIFAQNGAGTLSAPLIAGTTFTHPATPQSLNVQGTTPVSITGSWSTNSNSTMTYYQLIYSTDNFTTAWSTAIPFSSRFNGSTFLITGLLTSVQYALQVQAENPYGQTSPSASTTTTTFNGGAPAGSLAGILTAAGVSDFSGNLGGPSGRVIDMKSPGGAFPTDTSVTISTYGLADHGGALCTSGAPVPGLNGGDGIAFSIVDTPALQPAHPIFLTVSYTAQEAATFPAPASQLSLERFDPASGTCVPMPTMFNTATRTFLAQLNHFSLYQLMAVPLATSADTARIYPNPYHAATDGFVTIDLVPPSSRVRVFTLTGERILDGSADGTGKLTWAADNSAGRPIASGLYIVTVESGGSQKILKLAVIR